MLKQVTAAGIAVLAIGCGASSSAHSAQHSRPFSAGDCITTSLAAGKYYRASCGSAQYLVVTVIPGYPTVEAAAKCKKPQVAVSGPFTAMPDYKHNVTYCLKG